MWDYVRYSCGNLGVSMNERTDPDPLFLAKLLDNLALNLANLKLYFGTIYRYISALFTAIFPNRKYSKN